MRTASALRLGLVLCVGVHPTTALAQETPNFSGTWVLAVEESDFGIPQAALTGRTDRIEHAGTSLKIHRTQTSAMAGEGTLDMVYGIDGKEYRNESEGQVQVAVLRWDGPVLVIDSKVTTPQGTFLITDHYALSENGRTLTISRHLTVEGQMELDMKYVLHKS